MEKIWFVIISPSLLLILVSIVFFGYHQMLATALGNSFYRTPQIVWIDEINLASDKTIEIPFTIFLGPDEEDTFLYGNVKTFLLPYNCAYIAVYITLHYNVRTFIQ